MTTLREEIRQTRGFKSLEQEAYLNLIRTTAQLSDGVERVLKPFGITPAQYNVLRILHGSDCGLCRNEVRDRMVTRMPDMTRLLDRMEVAGLVQRTRSADDRRMVATHITEQGVALVEKAEVVVQAEHARALGHVPAEQLQALIGTLEQLRTRPR